MSAPGEGAAAGPGRVAPGWPGPDLLEREAESASIGQVLDDAQQGMGRLLVFEGPAGVGKSRLLQVFEEEAARRGMEGLSARCTELEADFPLGVVLQLFEPCLARADEGTTKALFAGAAALARPVFAAPVSAPGPDSLDHGLLHGLYWLTANLCERIGERRGLVVSIDDLQWADATSLRFLCHLALRIQDLPLVLALALRPEEEESDLIAYLRGHSAARVLTPQPLSMLGVEQMVRGSFPVAEEDFWQACGRATAGNPFLLVEMLASLAADGVAPTAAASGAVGAMVPESVLRSILTRLAKLGRPALDLATAVAVLGDRTPLRQAAALAQLDQAVAGRAADALAAAHILAPGEPVSFAHPLTAAAVRADLPPRGAAAAHRAAAELLVAEGAPPEEVATHLLAADPAADPKTVDVLREAASRALARGAAGPAVHFLTRALSEPPAPDLRGEVLADLALAEADAGVPEAVPALQRALEQVADPRKRAQILQALARILHQRGQYRKAAETARLGLDQLDASDPLREGLLADYLAAADFSPELRPQLLRYVDEAVAAMDAGKGPTHPMLVAQVALDLAFGGTPADRVVPVAKAAVAAGRSADLALHGRSLGAAMMALTCVGELDLADETVAEAMQLASRTGSQAAYAHACHWVAFLSYQRGHLAEAIANGEEAIELRHPGGNLNLGWTEPLLARCHLERGDLQEARLLVQAGEAVGPDDMAWAFVLEARGRLALVEGRPADALADLLAAGNHFGGRYLIDVPAVLQWRPIAALAAAALGEHAQARELASSAVARARQFGTLAPLGTALRVQGLVAGDPHGAELLAEAVGILQRSPNRLEHSRALVDLGGAWRRAGQTSRAREPLSQALELAENLGATLLAGQARQELRAAGARPRRIQRAGVASLTPTELRMAKLAAQGLSNPDIAQQLFVTTKTVEWHLAHVYQKLGIRSRRQLDGLIGANPV
jgi:DNA-binding CsgD family transcriptional regulator